MKSWTRWSILWLLVLVLGVGVFAASCGDDDDDDDDDDSGGGDDDDSGDDPPVVGNTTELEDTFDTDGPYAVQTDASDDVGLESVELFYRVDGGSFESVAMSDASGGTYEGEIPGQASGGLVEYYVLATDTAGQTASDPSDAPTSLFSYYVLAETELGYDDGVPENTYAAGGEGSYVFLRITPPDYPAYLRSISYYCEIGTGAEAEPFVFYEESGSGEPPDIEDAISVGDTFAPVEDDWTEIDLSAVAELATPLASGDFYIGFLNVTGTPAWGWDENFLDDNPVWTWAIGDGNWHHVTSFDGVVMYRAGVAMR